jgi:hypothetical protein
VNAISFITGKGHQLTEFTARVTSNWALLLKNTVGWMRLDASYKAERSEGLPSEAPPFDVLNHDGHPLLAVPREWCDLSPSSTTVAMLLLLLQTPKQMKQGIGSEGRQPYSPQKNPHLFYIQTATRLLEGIHHDVGNEQNMKEDHFFWHYFKQIQAETIREAAMAPDPKPGSSNFNRKYKEDTKETTRKRFALCCRSGNASFQ